MPATSKAQQRLMGMAYALKKGEMKPSDASKEVKDLADSMSLQQLKDYAETKHEGLPDHVEEALTGFFGAGPLVRYSTYPANISSSWRGIIRDKTDSAVQSFMDFIEGKKKKEDDDANEAIAATAPPGVAAPQNTPGMGNVTPPSAGNVGSGDRFDNDDEEGKVGLMSYEDYKKWIKKWQKQKSQK